MAFPRLDGRLTCGAIHAAAGYGGSMRMQRGVRMRPPLDGNILITGASSGIGRELARHLAGEARSLGLIARRTDRLTDLAAELTSADPDLQVFVFPCDLSDRRAVGKLVEQIPKEMGEIDILINNAGVGDVSFLHLSDIDRLHDLIQLNVAALLQLTHAFVTPMVCRGSGGILNVSSVLGFSFLPSMATYVGSKYFVTGFTESLRAEVGHQGIVVSQLCPGPVDTEFHRGAGLRLRKLQPEFLSISAHACAKQGINGFRKGKPLIVPGVPMRQLAWLMRIAPIGIVRWAQRLVAKRLQHVI